MTTAAETNTVTKDDRGLARRVLLVVAVSAAAGLSGTYWAHAAQDTCNACGAATDLFGGTGLVAVLGMAAYALLLVLALSAFARLQRLGNPDGTAPGRDPSGFSSLPAAGLLAAAGVHLALCWLLLRNRIPCPPCILTTGCACMGSAAVLWLDRRLVRRGAIVLLGALVVTTAAARLLRPRGEFWEHRAAVRAALGVLGETGALQPGAPRIVAFVRAGCPHCEHYRHEVLPAVLARYSRPPAASERPAPGRLKTPTVVVVGVTSFVFDGCPTIDDLHLAVRLAAGDSLGTQRPKLGIPVSR